MPRPTRKPHILIALFTLLVVAGYLLHSAEYLSQGQLEPLLQNLGESRWAPPFVLLLYILISVFGVPVSPLVFACGAVFGLLWGWALSFVGLLLGAIAAYFVARVLGSDLVLRLFGAARLNAVEKKLAQHGFWALVAIRFVPLPFSLVNFSIALAGIRLPTFVISSALGLAPSVFLYTYFGAGIVQILVGWQGSLSEKPLWVFLGVALAGAMALVVWQRRRSSRRNSVTESAPDEPEPGR